MTRMTVVVTRHPALVELLRERGLINADARVIAHATPADVTGKHVIGVLPLRLAALARSVTEVPLNIPAELRGVELSLETLRGLAGPAEHYVVNTTDGAEGALVAYAENDPTHPPILTSAEEAREIRREAMAILCGR